MNRAADARLLVPRRCYQHIGKVIVLLFQSFVPGRQKSGFEPLGAGAPDIFLKILATGKPIDEVEILLLLGVPREIPDIFHRCF